MQSTRQICCSRRHTSWFHHLLHCSCLFFSCSCSCCCCGCFFFRCLLLGFVRQFATPPSSSVTPSSTLGTTTISSPSPKLTHLLTALISRLLAVNLQEDSLMAEPHVISLVYTHVSYILQETRMKVEKKEEKFLFNYMKE